MESRAAATDRSKQFVKKADDIAALQIRPGQNKRIQVFEIRLNRNACAGSRIVRAQSELG